MSQFFRSIGFSLEIACHCFSFITALADTTWHKAPMMRACPPSHPEQQELSQKKTATGAQWWPFWREPDRGMSWPKGKELFHGYCSYMYSADIVFLTFRCTHARRLPLSVLLKVNCA